MATETFEQLFQRLRLAVTKAEAARVAAAASSVKADADAKAAAEATAAARALQQEFASITSAFLDTGASDRVRVS